MTKPDVKAFFDAETFTVSYVVSDPQSSRAVVIDPVLNYEPASGRTSTTSADEMIAYIKESHFEIDWLLETHVHADHLSGAQEIKRSLGGQTAIGDGVAAVQKTFKDLFNISDLAVDGRQFDHLFGDGETFNVGDIDARVIATPGHTPACVSYVIGNCAFVGDTVFMPDFGTRWRCSLRRSSGAPAAHLHPRHPA